MNAGSALVNITEAYHYLISRRILHGVFLLTVMLMLPLISACEKEAKLAPLSENARILAFGDSLTYGMGATAQNSYPAQLQQMSKHSVINAGISGEISARGLTRLPSLLAQHQPELIIICHGANDILRNLDLDKTSENIQQMINLAHAQNIQVMLVAVPQFSLFLSPHPMYEELALKNELPLVSDALSDILRQNQLKADRIHPNSEGYQYLAKEIYNQLVISGAL